MENQTVGPCPYCGSENTDCTFEALNSERMGYGVLWCNDCKRAYHISRMIVPEGYKKKPIPKGLAFTQSR